MTTVDSPQTPYKTPSATRESGQILHGQVESVPMLSDQSGTNPIAPTPPAKEHSVASMVASVSDTVNDQIKVAEIKSWLLAKLVPIIPEFSFSTWISGAAKVREYAEIVNELNRLRQSSVEEV